MQIAQQLYEGLEVEGEGAVGLITYIRTDSVRVATEAQDEAKSYILEHFGKASLPDKPPFYKTRAQAQGAHEAIRPTSLTRSPDTVKASLKRDQLRLYELIWRRFLASQMNPAVLDTVSADINAGSALFRATGSVVKFPGFMQVYTEGRDDDSGEEVENLPELTSGEALRLMGLDPKQHFTQPPPAYTEAMLVRAMEELGIGRPSTYAPTIETIQERGYVQLANRRFEPSELGFIVVDLLKEFFPEIIDVEFTADLESKLDGVEAGEADGQRILADFYGQFAEELAQAKEKMGNVKIADEETDEVCELCGRRMVIKHGRFGKFLACPGFPDCRNTKPLRRELEVACPDCGGALVERRSRKGRVFFGCANYPNCTFTSWNEPVAERCPQCGKIMVKKRRGRTETLACIDPQCGRAAGAGSESADPTGRGAKAAKAVKKTGSGTTRKGSTKTGASNRSRRRTSGK
jgi:DNA topoisomerase-1